MSFTLTFGQEGNCATAQVVWSVDGQTYNFRSDNNFVSWISTIFTVADYLSSSGGNTNPLVLPNNTNPNGWSLNTLDSGGVGGSITMIGSGGDGGLYPSNAGTINLSARLGGDGGSINLQGAQNADGSNKSAGGSIDLSAVYADGAPAGSIISMGGSTAGSAGGTLNMSGNGGNPGGSITMLGSGDGAGGSIITSGGTGSGPGGDINTSNNGGDITTTGNSNYSGGNINTSASGDASGGFIDTSADSASGGYIDTSNGGGNINTTGTGSIGFGTSGIRTTLVGSATEDRTITMPDSSGTMAVIFVGSATIDFANITANSTASSDVGVAGVLVGEAVLVTCTDARTGADQRVIFTGFVASTPDTVTVLATNTSGAGVDLPSLNFKIIVFRGL
jgi:hypothetical protein